MRYRVREVGFTNPAFYSTSDIDDILTHLENELLVEQPRSLIIEITQDKIQRINPDGTINISSKVVQQELIDLGYSGCMQDNDCACSLDSHQRDNAITNLYVKAYSGNQRS